MYSVVNLVPLNRRRFSFHQASLLTLTIRKSEFQQFDFQQNQSSDGIAKFFFSFSLMKGEVKSEKIKNNSARLLNIKQVLFDILTSSEIETCLDKCIVEFNKFRNN